MYKIEPDDYIYNDERGLGIIPANRLEELADAWEESEKLSIIHEQLSKKIEKQQEELDREK